MGRSQDCINFWRFPDLAVWRTRRFLINQGPFRGKSSSLRCFGSAMSESNWANKRSHGGRMSCSFNRHRQYTSCKGPIANRDYCYAPFPPITLSVTTVPSACLGSCEIARVLKTRWQSPTSPFRLMNCSTRGIIHNLATISNIDFHCASAANKNGRLVCAVSIQRHVGRRTYVYGCANRFFSDSSAL